MDVFILLSSLTVNFIILESSLSFSFPFISCSSFLTSLFSDMSLMAQHLFLMSSSFVVLLAASLCLLVGLAQLCASAVSSLMILQILTFSEFSPDDAGLSLLWEWYCGKFMVLGERGG